ncbi:hypothetical protein LINGRAHAP2_LOCUS35275 [Linum grandiflorum]
MENVWDVGFTY